MIGVSILLWTFVRDGELARWEAGDPVRRRGRLHGVGHPRQPGTQLRRGRSATENTNRRPGNDHEHGDVSPRARRRDRPDRLHPRRLSHRRFGPHRQDHPHPNAADHPIPASIKSRWAAIEVVGQLNTDRDRRSSRSPSVSGDRGCSSGQLPSYSEPGAVASVPGVQCGSHRGRCGVMRRGSGRSTR